MPDFDQNFKCVLEFLRLNVTVKPVILSIIAGIRTFLAAMIAAIEVDSLSLDIEYQAKMLIFNALEPLYNSIVSSFDGIAGSIQGLPCAPLGDFLDAFREQLRNDPVSQSYFQYKKELLDKSFEKKQFTAKADNLRALDKNLEKLTYYINNFT